MNKSLSARIVKLETKHAVDAAASNLHYERTARLGKIFRCSSDDEADRLLAEDPERFVIYRTFVEPRVMLGT